MIQDKPDILDVIEDCLSDDELSHYGMPRRSGRFPWGSGKEPYQRSGDFLARIEELTNNGLRESEIADIIGLTTTQYRTQKSLALEERRQLQVDRAKGLREKGYSLNEIAREMGFKNDSSVRSLLNSNSEARMKQAKNTANFLRDQVDKKGMIDVGAGVERELGVSKEKLNQALYLLEREGYEVYGGGVSQVNNVGKQTNIKVLCKPGTDHKEIYDYKNVKSIIEYSSHDDGVTFDKLSYPSSFDSKRLQIKYAEDGGTKMDGVVEIRRGVPELSLGNSNYAQVRILVDGTHYIKGMAVYADDLPPGVDMRFNTNKTKDKSKMDVLKEIKDDPDNPFGALIKAGGQSYYTDKNGKRKLSPINKTREEGDWGEWADKLPSQFLSKQNLSLIKKQLGLAEADKMAEFEEIMSLTNPTVKKALLKSFSDNCDAAAVHLQAAALPRQKYQVILPISSMRDNEIYAPNYKDGEQVALVRYPHGGLFEIPILTVNNKQKDAIRMIGKNAADAVGINSKVADRLSGADFDGDTVMVIPTGKGVKISNKQPLKELEGFDPKMEYPERPGMKYMKTDTKDNTQTEMGKISNLITDMTLFGASDEELARAVKHSMVVIDAGKHKLDYKQSEKDNGIAALKKKYQGHIDENGRYREGAGTIISRAKGETTVVKRRGTPTIDVETGKQSWKTTKKPTYTKTTVSEKTGKVTTKEVTKTQKSTRMFEADDAFELVSNVRHPKEIAYAEYANKMKALANESRKVMINTKETPYNREAYEKYEPQVQRLKAALNVALKNAPRERQAQTMANAVIQAKKQDNPNMTKKEIKKAGQQALDNARRSVGAKRELIEISDLEWEAIQAGAVTPSMLRQILNNSNMDTVKQLAMPRTTNGLSPAKQGRIDALTAAGYTNAQIAEALGVSTSTISKYIKGKGGN